MYHATTDKVTTEVVVDAFVQFVAQKSPDAFAIVVIDNASIHRSTLFKRKCLEWLNQRVHMIYLSKYSPELNLIEILWRKVKCDWLPVTAYKSFGALDRHVKRIFQATARNTELLLNRCLESVNN